MPILLGLLLLPAIEIAGFILLAPYLGFLGIVALVAASSIFGCWLLQQEGMAAGFRFRASILAGERPIPAALDSALRLSAALLWIVPGFFSDFLGLLLLIPPLRAMLVRLIVQMIIPTGIDPKAVFTRTNDVKVVVEADFEEVGSGNLQLPPPQTP